MYTPLEHIQLLAYNGTSTIGDALQARSVHKSISTVGLSYAGGGTSLGVTYYEKAGTVLLKIT